MQKIAAMIVINCFAIAAAAETASPALSLLMVDAPGCPYCAAWTRDVGGEYALTEEGARAPLRRIALRDAPRADIAFARPVRYTPTFILVEDGREIGRIEGYPGESFFWGLLGGLLNQVVAAE